MKCLAVCAQVALLAGALSAVSSAQAPASGPAAQMSSAQMIAAEQAAMAKLGLLDGVWRGTGSMIDRPGETPRDMIDTLRVGSFLDGTVKVIEIRDYLPDGSIGFHAFNTIAYDPAKSQYVMNARGGGRSGNFSFELTSAGYLWTIGSADRGLRYRGTIKGNTWSELGQSVSAGQARIQMSQWTVHRIGHSHWPEDGAVTAR